MDKLMILAICSVLSFIVTFILLKLLPGEMSILGHDRGRKFAEGSQVNVGKPTGVGFYFVCVFAVLTAISNIVLLKDTSVATIAMIILVILSMVFGLLDDRSKAPWGEYIKGFLDFLVAVAGGILFANNCALISLTGYTLSINKIVYIILATILIIVSINATNATDGIDGLSGTMSILTILTLSVSAYINGTLNYAKLAPASIFIMALLAYLIFNHFPSKMLMGDAGSRAIGFFIAYYAMSLDIPFAYLIVGLPFLLDGGISILKITIGRLTHKKVIILKNITTPFHDHLRKRLSFTVPKTWLILISTTVIIDIVYLLIVFTINKA